MADDETWEDLAKRLAALVIKLDERNERLDTWIAGQDAINTRLTVAVESLTTLMREVFQQRHNGHEA
jgi:hypothetical protein